MGFMNRIRVVALVIAVAFFAGIPATASAGSGGVPKYFLVGTFVDVGNEPHAAGMWYIDWSKDFGVSCRGLTPGATYVVVVVYADHAVDVGGFVAGKGG